MLEPLLPTSIQNKEIVTPKLNTYPLGGDVDTFARVHVLAPRAFYSIDMHQSFMSFADGVDFTFGVEYSDVSSLHVLPKETGLLCRDYEPKVFVVLTLKSPVFRGPVPYSSIVVQFPLVGLSFSTLSLNEDPQRGAMESFINSLTLRLRDRITSPGNFRSHGNDYAFKAGVGVDLGFLYPLEGSFFYIPTVTPSRHIMYQEIDSVEFVPLPECSTRKYFHLLVRKTTGEKFIFEYINYDEHFGLYTFLESHGLKVSNIDLECLYDVESYLYGDPDKVEEDEFQCEDADADADEDEFDPVAYEYIVLEDSCSEDGMSDF